MSNILEVSQNKLKKVRVCIITGTGFVYQPVPGPPAHLHSITIGDYAADTKNMKF